MFLLYKHLKKQRKEKIASQRREHQENIATDPETSPTSSHVINTAHTTGLQNDTSDAPTGQVGIEEHHGQSIGLPGHLLIGLDRTEAIDQTLDGP